MLLTERVRLVAMVLCGVIVAGCGGSGSAARSDDPRGIPTVQAEAVPAPGPLRKGLPGPLELDLEQTNDDGVSVRIDRITFEPEEILVDLVVHNRSSTPIALASSPYTGMTLVDDHGHSYNFQVPDQNKALRVEPGQTYEGRISFLGELGGRASSLTLTTNAGADGDAFVPRFEFTGIRIEE
jgi:hypothetical protein